MNLLLVPRPAWQLFAASLLVGLFLSGCAGSGRWSDPSGGRERREAALRDGGVAVEGARGDLLSPTLTSVNNRIYSYERRLEEWKKVEKKMAGATTVPPDKAGRMEECRLQLQDILNGYHTLRNRLLQAGPVDAGLLPAGDLLLQLNRQDVDYLEGGCGRLLAELEAAPAAPPVRPAGPDPQIKAAYDSAEYDPGPEPLRAAAADGRPAARSGHRPPLCAGTGQKSPGTRGPGRVHRAARPGPPAGSGIHGLPGHAGRRRSQLRPGGL